MTESLINVVCTRYCLEHCHELYLVVTLCYRASQIRLADVSDACEVVVMEWPAQAPRPRSNRKYMRNIESKN